MDEMKKLRIFGPMIENKKYIHWMAMLGLVVVIGLQGVWLRNTFALIKNNLNKKDVSFALEKALDEESNMRFITTPKGTRIKSGPTNDTIPPNAYFYERLSDMGYPMVLENVDSIAQIFLDSVKVDGFYNVYLVNIKEGKRLAQTKAEEPCAWLRIAPKPFPIRSDYTQGVQLVVINPMQTLLSRMGLLLAATAVMMLFVIFCIVWQVKILRRMSRVLRIREDFSYAMVHDMKTPLSSIIMTLQPLHQGRLDDKPEMKERFFRIAEEEAQHLLALTNKILTLSKLEHHRLHLMPEPLPLRPLVEKLAENLAPKCPKPLRISYDLRVESLYADPEFWPEVMQNLLDNAVKYTRPDAEAVEIHVSTRSKGYHTELRIRDNGRGIPRRHLRTIFDKYERASAERDRQQQDGAPAGFGLGLSFVRQVVRAHGGTIRAESEEGRWTEFVILMKNEELRMKNAEKEEEDEKKDRNIEYSNKDMEISVKKSEQGKQIRVKIGNLWKGKGVEINIENSEKGKSVTINKTIKDEGDA